jgi:hypothetical protein
MKAKPVLYFIAAAAIAFFAASYRFYDSAHTIGLIKASGGEARHPIVLDPGLDRYTVIATASVIPPYRGDIRIAVEGLPGMDWQLHNSVPAIDLSPWRHPELRDNILYDVQPKDRLALWLVMQPTAGAPAVTAAPTAAVTAAASPSTAAGDCCVAASPPAEHTGHSRTESATKATPAGPLLAFYDLRSGNRVLTIPITFRGKGGDHGVVH